MRLTLPPRCSFSKLTASPFISYLMKIARLMLKNEQIREKKGDAAEGDVLVKQMICTCRFCPAFDEY